MNHSALLRYGIAVLTVGLVLLIQLLFPFLVQQTPFLLSYVAIVIAAWFGGLGPGLLATALVASLTDYFFLPPTIPFPGWA
jgi:K+-sensing histidine kinase KdpD